MIVAALTGSIGMGKSTTAKLFAEAGAAVYDADAEVHKLYQRGGEAVAPVEAAFPGVAASGAVDRNLLSQRVLGSPTELARLNSIVWPLLRASRRRFTESAQESGADIAILDIPLLFETGGEADFDAVVVVSAPAEVQRQRVLLRKGMDAAKLEAIMAAQAPDELKRAKADFIVDTSRGLEAARAQVDHIMRVLRATAE